MFLLNSKTKIIHWSFPQKGFIPIWIAIALATVLISGGISILGVISTRNRAMNPPPARGGGEEGVGANAVTNMNVGESSPVPDPVANWKTYRNEEYGFEVKYPKNEIEISANNNGYPKGTRFVFPANDFSIIVDPNYQGDIRDYKYLGGTSRGITQDNYAMYSDHTSSVPYDAYVTKFDGNVYIIEFVAGIESRELQILSTFKFIEPDSTANWKTYRNEEYGFEVKYPADHTMYESVNQKNQTLTPATSTSTHATIATNEAHLFCCEALVLSIEVIAERVTPQVWLARNKLRLIPESEGNQPAEITVFGKTAWEVFGGGNLGSLYKLIVIENDDHLIVISQNQQHVLFDQILSTFKFIEP